MAIWPPKACQQQIGMPIVSQKYADVMLPIEDYSEDCLTLNIWTPRTALDSMFDGFMQPKQETSKKLAVMVWIHGGGFSSGSTQVPMYNASALAAYNNVVVVSIQYRLGAFGFSKNSAPPPETLRKVGCVSSGNGNMGLHDQTLALEWIKENIEKFGGDKNRITLFGQGTGATSIAYHLRHCESQDLFQRAILQSGYIPSDSWESDDENSLDIYAVMSQESLDDSQNVFVQNMKQPTSEEILRAQNVVTMKNAEDNAIEKPNPEKPGETMKYFSHGLLPYSFLPTRDFFSRHISQSDDNKNDITKDIMIGSNKQDGAFHMLTSVEALRLFPNPLDMDKKVDHLTSEHYEQFIREYFVQLINKVDIEGADEEDIKQDQAILIDTIKSQYMCGMTGLKGEQILEALVTATTDFLTACSSARLAKHVKRPGNVYAYQFEHRLNAALWPRWMGSTFGDEIPFVMGFPFTSIGQREFNFTLAEKLLSRQMMTYWTNFAKFGDPNKQDPGNPNGQLLALNKWPKFSADNKNYALNISAEYSSLADPVQSQVLEDFKVGECNLWNNLLPRLIKLSKFKEI